MKLTADRVQTHAIKSKLTQTLKKAKKSQISFPTLDIVKYLHT